MQAHHVFLHVPKTAGSSLRTVLSRQYGARHVLYCDLGAGDRRPMPEIAAEVRARMAGRDIRLITGHQFLGLHVALREPCLYFSLLRDPVERILSEYFYAFSYPHHAQRAEIVSGALSPLEFLTGARNGAGDAQARQLAGRGRGPVLEAALAHLTHSLAVVGIAEEFDRSLLLMARRLGWAPPLYVARNVTRLAPEQTRARDAARAAAVAHRGLFATDIALHQAAAARFAADCAAEGPAFETAFAAFARLQAALAEGAGARVFERYEFREDDALPVHAAALRDSADFRVVADFLAAPPVARLRPRNILGRIDRLERGLLQGWALDLLDPAPVVVELRGAGGVLGATRAQLWRADLAQAGLADGCCAFRLALPEAASDARLVVADTGIEIPDPSGVLRPLVGAA